MEQFVGRRSTQTALRLLVLLIVTVCIAWSTCAVAAARPLPFSIAFYYASKPPLDELQAFDIAVVDPDTVGISPRTYTGRHSELFAYVSIGEVEASRSYYGSIQSQWLIGDNPAWKSKLVDLANPAWRSFFLDQIFEPLWAAGYRGFFLDTLDSYQLVKDSQRHPQLAAGLVTLIREIKRRHPEARLIMNRGFEVLEQVKDVAFAVAAESLFRNFDPVTGKYGEVKEQDRRWLLDRFGEVRKAGLPVIAIDYLAPGDRGLARETAARIAALGIIPWVADKDLASLGVGSIEVLPRKILGLYHGSEGPDPVYVNLQRFAITPLNYLGYQVELHDLRHPLPSAVLAGRYAGVVIWPNSDSAGSAQGLSSWLQRIKSEGVRFVFLSQFGVPARSLDWLGVRTVQMSNRGRVQVVSSDSMIGFETTPAAPQAAALLPVRISGGGQALVTVGSGGKPLVDAAALTEWGGFVLDPFVLSFLGEQQRWVVNPFEFFQRALQLGNMPVPDVTTENGARLLLSHIDADGFESRVERYDAPYAVTEHRERILKRYRIPTTYSIITSTLGDRAVETPLTKALQQEARTVFELPWVEAGSHTYSHPFYWQNTTVARQGYERQYLPIPGYAFILDAEIDGSIRFIEQRLLPAGKRVKLLQWSGDCTPDAETLARTYAAGVGNINGGDTLISETNRSLTAVAPLGVSKGDYFQVFAPNQNENVYTNLWTGPFYGYRRVIESFRLTDTPRRLKPINIYYHLYAVTKEASMKALDEAHQWALTQRPNAIFTSEYVAKVLDFNRTVVARQGDGWLIRNAGELRELRLPLAAGYPDLQHSRNVIGYSDHGDSRYLHLAPGGEALVVMGGEKSQLPYLRSYGGTVTQFRRIERGVSVTLVNRIETKAVFGAAAGCRLQQGIGLITQGVSAGDSLTVTLPAGSHTLEFRCR